MALAGPRLLGGSGAPGGRWPCDALPVLDGACWPQVLHPRVRWGMLSRMAVEERPPARSTWPLGRQRARLNLRRWSRGAGARAHRCPWAVSGFAGQGLPAATPAPPALPFLPPVLAGGL